MFMHSKVLLAQGWLESIVRTLTSRLGCSVVSPACAQADEVNSKDLAPNPNL